MSILPTISMISGSGKPRLVLVQSQPFYTATGGTTYTSTNVTEAESAAITITSSSVANPTSILTASAHGRTINDWINIVGHTGSTPDINGKWQVIDVPDATHLKIQVNVTTGGSGGTLRRTPAFANRGMAVNRYVSVEPGSATANPLRWGKVTAIDDANNILTVDQWIGGTPSTNDVFRVNGWVADLPYCYKLTETFAPDLTVHNLWRGRKSAKHYGWEYSVNLDYAKYLAGDVLLLLKYHLAMESNDNLVFTPRVDQPLFNYNVFISDPISVSMFGKGLGHQDIVVNLVGKDLVPSWPMSQGFGLGYGLNYGNQL